MRSLIAGIAEQHGIGRENLATELLAMLLRDPIGRNCLSRFLRCSFGVNVSDRYEIETQRTGPENRAIPDLQVREREDTQAIIESKFAAALTGHQPKSYLDKLARGGVLIFVVPEKRQSEVFRKIEERCGSELICDPARQFQAALNDKTVAVLSWESIIDVLRPDDAVTMKKLSLENFTADLEQLRRYCDVAKKEVFRVLTSEQVAGVGIAEVLHHLTWLTREVINRCISHDIVQRIDRKGLEARIDLSLYFGQDLKMGEVAVWLGFYGRAWEEYGVSPLWIEIQPGGVQVTQAVTKQEEQSRVYQGFGDDNSVLVPIPIKAGATQEELVDSAFRFLSELKTRLTV